MRKRAIACRVRGGGRVPGKSSGANLALEKITRTAALPLHLLQSFSFALLLLFEASHGFLDGAHVITSLLGAFQALLLKRGKLCV